MTSLLIIGYGNELRGDDAVGPVIARVVAGWEKPGVQVLTAHQLLAEMVVPLSEAETVIFVDACLQSGVERGPILEPLGEGPAPRGLGHVCDPRWLLDLAQLVQLRRPAAWLLRVPVRDLELGQPLSPEAREGVRGALRLLREFLRQEERHWVLLC